MIVKPSHHKPRPIALVTPGWRSLRIETIDGARDLRGPGRVFDALQSLRGHVVYANGLLPLLQTTGATRWQARTWKGRAVSVKLDGTTAHVTSLRDAMGECPGDRRFEALLQVKSWLEAHGVAMGSLSAMAWHLWSASLARPVTIASLPAIGQSAFYGPRQEVREPRTYRHMAIVDLARAYPSQMAARPFALTLREVSNGTRIDPERSGLARARVRVPHALALAPLPTRVAPSVIQWRTGDLHGIWPWCELHLAKELGCTVEVERCFAPMDEQQPFADWYRLVEEFTTLPGTAGRVAKCVANALWGMFAMAGDHSADVRWLDDEGRTPIVVGRPSRKLPQAATAHIAAETAARVRVRTLTEIYSMDAYPVHIDTDGVIVRRSVASRYPKSGPPGTFRRKTTLRKVQIRAPQLLRYQCDQDCCVGDAGTMGHWHYVASGMTHDHAAELFDRVAPSRVSVLERDAVLPPLKGYELDRIEPYLKEAKVLRSMLFGERLA